MVVLAGSQVWWTWEVEDVFAQVKKGNKLGMKNYAKKMHQQIGDLVVKVSYEAQTTQQAKMCPKSWAFNAYCPHNGQTLFNNSAVIRGWNV